MMRFMLIQRKISAWILYFLFIHVTVNFHLNKHVCNMIICCFALKGLCELDRKERRGGDSASAGNDQPSAVFCWFCSGLSPSCYSRTLFSSNFTVYTQVIVLFYLCISHPVFLSENRAFNLVCV